MADLIDRKDALNAIKPLYGWSIAAGEELEAAIAALPAQGVGGVEAHVNKAPKSEQDAGDVLTDAQARECCDLCGSDVTDMDGHTVHDDDCPEGWQAQATIRKSQTVAPAPVDALVKAAEDAEYDLLQWLECGPELVKAGFNMDGTGEVVEGLRAALAAYRGEAK